MFLPSLAAYAVNFDAVLSAVFVLDLVFIPFAFEINIQITAAVNSSHAQHLLLLPSNLVATTERMKSYFCCQNAGFY